MFTCSEKNSHNVSNTKSETKTEIDGGKINNNNNKNLFFNKYKFLIKKYNEFLENAETEYRENVISPKSMFNLPYNFNFIKRFAFEEEGFLKPKDGGFPVGLVYIQLRDEKDNRLFFYGGVSYDIESGKIAEVWYEQDFKILKILINNKWYELVADRDRDAYVYQIHNKEQIALNYQKVSKMDYDTPIISPIINQYALLGNYFPLEYIDGPYAYNGGRDLTFLLYNRIKEIPINSVIFPATDHYKTFEYGIGPMDSQYRIYLRFVPTSQKGDSWFPGMSEGHIMIYDLMNNVLYNIRHPFFNEENRNEELWATQYIVGEDGNIYYQLVTDKAYYIYRITPLWDESMEETEYNPIFFEFYPELKKIWDEME